MTDLAIGDVSPRKLAHSLRHVSATIEASQSDLREFESQLTVAAQARGEHIMSSPGPTARIVSTNE